MAIGYACIPLGLNDSGMRGCMIKNASPERLKELVADNLHTLFRVLDYNLSQGISLFRISSDMIPFGSHPAIQYPWWDQHADTLQQLGEKIRRSDMRVSMHPGQYTVLNAPDEEIAERAVADLDYHARFLDAMGLDARHKIILHLGGVYGDPVGSLTRFKKNYRDLSAPVKRRLVIENDEKYHIGQVLELAGDLKLPAVLDVFHHQCYPAPDDVDIYQWLDRAGTTWQDADGVQKIHYSQQEIGLRTGAHARSIQLQPFLDFYDQLPDRQLDIMLECKDKDISAIKCQLSTSPNPPRELLEAEWVRYKYLVMEHSQRHDQSIGKLFGSSRQLSAKDFYQLVEEALIILPERGQAMNAAQHVWGYFKKLVTDREKAAWQEKMQQYQSGAIASANLKAFLYRLSKKYDVDYLLESYYFVL